MEKEKDICFPFICLNNPSKFSFKIKLSPADVEILEFKELIKMAKKRANKLGTSIGKLYDFYKNAPYEENTEKVKNNNVAYFQVLFPFKFYEPIKIKVLVIASNREEQTEKIKEIEVFPYSTIEELSAEVYTNFNCPLGEQNLLFNDFKLSNDLSKTLFDYDIKAGSIINLICVKAKENNKVFLDIQKNKFVDKNFTDNEPKYRICTTGINIEGCCLNLNCEAFDKQVICPIRDKLEFDLIKDTDKIVCPLCNNNFEPLTCGFTGCYYTYTGRKKVGKKPDNYNLQKYTRVKKDVYRLFDPTESGKVEWEYLRIIIMHENPILDRLKEESVFCAFCNSYDNLEGEIYCKKEYFPNESYFHDKCYYEFISTSNSSNDST